MIRLLNDIHIFIINLSNEYMLFVVLKIKQIFYNYLFLTKNTKREESNG